MKNIKYSKKIKIFCQKNNINLTSLKPLKNDTSRRKYYRFTNDKKILVNGYAPWKQIS